MLVTVQHPFEYLGRTVPPGTRIDVDPLQATILRRAGMITLSDGLPSALLATTDADPVEPFEPDPDPVETTPDPPDAVPARPTRRRRGYTRRDVTTDAGSPGGRQTYKRRDLTAEPPDEE
jgi:hypothetical protein